MHCHWGCCVSVLMMALFAVGGFPVGVPIGPSAYMFTFGRFSPSQLMKSAQLQRVQSLLKLIIFLLVGSIKLTSK